MPTASSGLGMASSSPMRKIVKPRDAAKEVARRINDMTTHDLIEETYIALSANKARSGLTMLGIVIGIASVIALMAIGNGAQNSVAVLHRLARLKPHRGAARRRQADRIRRFRRPRHGALADRATTKTRSPKWRSSAVSGEYSGRYQVAVAGRTRTPAWTASTLPTPLSATSR